LLFGSVRNASNYTRPDKSKILFQKTIKKVD
ncbi:hypothetical protein AAUPMG_03417, partial [Pasteurella multocida subsp. multocida str. Anand1_goat]